MLNEAQSEARSIQEISRSLEGSGDDPIRYLLSLKYIDALKTIWCRTEREGRFRPAGDADGADGSALGSEYDSASQAGIGDL